MGLRHSPRLEPERLLHRERPVRPSVCRLQMQELGSRSEGRETRAQIRQPVRRANRLTRSLQSWACTVNHERETPRLTLIWFGRTLS